MQGYGNRNIYKDVFTCIYMSDRKKMKKVREKRIKAMDKQISVHEQKIEIEKPVKDTTMGYWEKEIEEKFKKIKDDDEKYLKENN